MPSRAPDNNQVLPGTSRCDVPQKLIRSRENTGGDTRLRKNAKASTSNPENLPDFSQVFKPDDPGLEKFQALVLQYYHSYGRKMLWRETTDPYSILVSEIMLQQTQVERVAAKYPEFIKMFPDFKSLAEAPLGDILQVWQGMGYNRRAIALQKCAILVNCEYSGHLPEDPETLVQFPGIGKATAASIAAFAFNRPVAFIETNIRRVFIHFFFRGRDDVHDDEIFPLVQKTVYKKDPRTWYWSLMDLGTALKKGRANANLRSAHYSRQSRFEGSDRKVRGAILRLLVQSGEMGLAELAGALSEPADRVSSLLASLKQEGFIIKNHEKFRIAA